jgi:hypothetical protein
MMALHLERVGGRVLYVKNQQLERATLKERVHKMCEITLPVV